MKKIFFTLAVIGLTVACKNEASYVELEDSNKKESLEWEVTTAEQKRNELDAISDELSAVKSLRWEKTTDESSFFIEVTAFVDSKGNLSKLVESFYDSQSSEQGEHIYYLERDEIYATVELVDTWVDTNYVVLTEKETYYNEQGKAIAARQRSAESVDDIPYVDWEKARPEEISIDRAMDVLTGQAPYNTHFISYIQGEQSLFLLLGEPKKEDRFITAVRVDKMTPFLNDLLENAEENKFKEVEVTFKVVGGGSDPEFRVLETINWKN